MILKLGAAAHLGYTSLAVTYYSVCVRAVVSLFPGIKRYNGASVPLVCGVAVSCMCFLVLAVKL